VDRDSASTRAGDRVGIVARVRDEIVRLLRDRRVRYLIVGGWNTLFGYLAYVAFLRLFPTHYLAITVPAQFVAIVNAYLCQRFFVFGTDSPPFAAFFRFNVVYWIAYFVNLGALKLLVEGLGMNKFLAPIPITAVNVVVTYFTHQRYSFRAR
jgi:putative flippase GtrA